MNRLDKIKKVKGSALVAVLLVMLMISAIALSVISRTTTNLKMSFDTRKSQSSYQSADLRVEAVLNAIREFDSANDVGTANILEKIKISNLCTKLVENACNALGGWDIKFESYDGTTFTQIAIANYPTTSISEIARVGASSASSTDTTERAVSAPVPQRVSSPSNITTQKCDSTNPALSGCSGRNSCEYKATVGSYDPLIMSGLVLKTSTDGNNWTSQTLLGQGHAILSGPISSSETIQYRIKAKNLKNFALDSEDVLVTNPLSFTSHVSGSCDLINSNSRCLSSATSPWEKVSDSTIYSCCGGTQCFVCPNGKDFNPSAGTCTDHIWTCGDSVSFTYKGSSVTYGTVLNTTTNKCWLKRNLGATTEAPTSSTDSTAYGDLFQWGRLSDLHQNRTSLTTAALSSTDIPGHPNFILSIYPYDWRSPKNDNLWQGVSGVNNPCPTGFRIPTETEWTAERTSWSSNNSAGAFASKLKLTLAGVRLDTGDIFSSGSLGNYWSSNLYGTYSRRLSISSGDASVSAGSRGHGMSIRCIKD